MQLAIALPSTTATEVTFAIARLSDPGRCPVLGAQLQQAVSGLIGGMPVVLVHRDSWGEMRAYGRRELVAAIVGIDFDEQLWAPFELPDLPREADVDQFAA